MRPIGRRSGRRFLHRRLAFTRRFVEKEGERGMNRRSLGLPRAAAIPRCCSGLTVAHPA